jgi:hypothetical protein
VTAAEKFKGGLRLTFVCGGRALRSLRQLRDAVAGSVRVLSVLPHGAARGGGEAAGRGKGLRKTIAGLQAALAVHEADRLLAAPTGRRPARHHRDLRGLGRRWPQDHRVVADCARSVAVALVTGGPTVDGGRRLRTVARARRRRGGQAAHGSLRWPRRRPPEMAQAGGLSGHTAEIASAARALLER